MPTTLKIPFQLTCNGQWTGNSGTLHQLWQAQHEWAPRNTKNTEYMEVTEHAGMTPQELETQSLISSWLKRRLLLTLLTLTSLSYMQAAQLSFQILAIVGLANRKTLT